MKLHQPELERNGPSISLSCKVEGANGFDRIWFSFDKEFEPYLATERADGFLVGLLLEAMKTGESIEVLAPLSERLYFNIKTTLLPISAAVFPELKPIEIKAHVLTDEVFASTKGVATGFSAGVDSFSVLAHHFFSPVSDGYKITDLLFNNVGSHGRAGGKEKSRALFESRYRKLVPVCTEMGLPFIRVDSNLDDIVSMNFHVTNTSRNMAVALLLQRHLGKYYYASTYDYKTVKVRKADDLTYADPILVPAYSTESLEMLLSCGAYTRVEKTHKISDIDIVQKHLDVCIPAGSQIHDTNCSECFKCLRTMLTLELMNKLDDFDAVFDRDIYKIKRSSYIREVISSNNPLLQEIAAFAAIQGVRFSTKDRYLGNFLRLVQKFFVPWRVRKLVEHVVALV